MRFPIWLTIVAALIGFGGVLAAGQLLVQPDLPLIINAAFDDDVITPNADGETDITTFRYELSRNASISLTFEGEDGTLYRFRDGHERAAFAYSVLFSGVVDGYTLPDENVPGSIERRLMPDGAYTWRFIAENAQEREEISGTLRIQDADSPLPIMSTFTVGSRQFTPNQDGVNDRLTINVYLDKAEADVELFLLGENGGRIPITERLESSEAENSRRFTFDYAGGVDLGQDPPPDGDYTIVALAQDDEGQRIRREAQVSILRGGKPRAEIEPQVVDADVIWEVRDFDESFASDIDDIGDPITMPVMPEAVNVNQITVPIGQMLVFRLTVDNYSDVPLRTTGPMPGTVYEQDQFASSLGAYEEPGAWRVGINCDTSLLQFPYRWAIGTPDVLETIVDPDTGREFTYLPPNTTATVWGAVRMTEIYEQQNPQTCWAGLIHEQVAVSPFNNFVGPIEVQLVDPLASVTD